VIAHVGTTYLDPGNREGRTPHLPAPRLQRRRAWPSFETISRGCILTHRE
jgi:hypothetical protein